MGRRSSKKHADQTSKMDRKSARQIEQETEYLEVQKEKAEVESRRRDKERRALENILFRSVTPDTRNPNHPTHPNLSHRVIPVDSTASTASTASTGSAPAVSTETARSISPSRISPSQVPSQETDYSDLEWLICDEKSNSLSPQQVQDVQQKRLNWLW